MASMRLQGPAATVTGTEASSGKTVIVRTH